MGNVFGNISGDVSGSILGNVEGNIRGRVTGSVKGTVGVDSYLPLLNSNTFYPTPYSQLITPNTAAVEMPAAKVTASNHIKESDDNFKELYFCNF